MADEQCFRDDNFAWCVYHYMPYVPYMGEDVCLSVLGVSAYDGPLLTMFAQAQSIREERNDAQSEIDTHECDHDECISYESMHDYYMEDPDENPYKRWLKDVIEVGVVPEEAKIHMLGQSM